MKRYRTPKCKDGELKLYYGKLPGESPDIVVAWSGSPAMRQDSNLLMSTFTSKKPDVFVDPLWSVMIPSFVDELIARGYDIETIKFSITKKNEGK